jgi:TPR repeat protein
VQLNTNEALKWYRLAAEKGDSKAQFTLGFYYEAERATNPDYKEALKWYRLSAAQGYAGAQNQLGICYNNGLGVKKNPMEAYKWFILACHDTEDPNHVNCLLNCDNAKSTLTKSQITKAENDAKAIQDKIDRGD